MRKWHILKQKPNDYRNILNESSGSPISHINPFLHKKRKTLQFQTSTMLWFMNYTLITHSNNGEYEYSTLMSQPLPSRNMVQLTNNFI